MQRSRSRVRLAALLISIGLVGGLLPSAAAASLAAQGAKITLEFWGQDPAHDYIEPLAREFEAANPNIKIEITKSPQAQYFPQVRNAIAAGNPPDVLLSNAGYSNEASVLTLGEANVLENLAKEPWAKKIPEEFKSSVSIGKKVFAPPLNLATIPTFYNKKVFADNDLKIPKTYTELLDICASLSAENITPIALAGQFPVAITMPVQGLAASTVYVKDPEFAQKRLDGKTTFAGNKQWKLALDRYVEMNNKGCFGADVVAQGFTTARNAFATNKAGMFIFTGGVTDSMKDINPALEFGSFAFPGSPKASETRLPVGVGFVPVIPKGADEKAAAKKFVAFLVKNADKVAIAANAISLDGPLQPEFAEQAPQLESGDTVTFIDQLWPNAATLSALEAGLQDLLLGRRTAIEVLTEMDRTYDQP